MENAKLETDNKADLGKGLLSDDHLNLESDSDTVNTAESFLPVVKPPCVHTAEFEKSLGEIVS